jgi:hypothetical protein
MKLIKIKDIGYLAWPITDNIVCEMWDIFNDELYYLDWDFKGRFLTLLFSEINLLKENLSEFKEDK